MKENILNELLYEESQVNEILDLLPDEPYISFTILSMVIDKYSKRIGRSSRESWKMLYNVAMAVHDEEGIADHR